ncbi:hypothetical protein R1flu_024003 [Riccia fluitans]|uniref:AAA+ ATPase domain-containing protein n=1 Tax=Riccia fluitans TaxID=41844 RepID=A0ABD1XWN5_9MARC
MAWILMADALECWLNSWLPEEFPQGRVLCGKRFKSAPLVEYLEVFSKVATRLNTDFARLRHQQGWKAVGVCEANETSNSISLVAVSSSLSKPLKRKSESSLVVEEASARYDVDDFSVLEGEDNISISKPKDQTSTSYRFLVDVIREVVETEKSKRQFWMSFLRLLGIFVIMQNHVDEVIRQLRLTDVEGLWVALVGMSGIGKTTLAKAVLLQIQEQFEFTVFVGDVKKKLKSRYLEDLIAESLAMGMGRKVEEIHHQASWIQLEGKKVLIVLDDVESPEQISYVLSDGWLGKESRIMITTQLRSDFVRAFTIYEVPFLTPEESKSLFLAHLDLNDSWKIQ